MCLIGLLDVHCGYILTLMEVPFEMDAVSIPICSCCMTENLILASKNLISTFSFSISWIDDCHHSSGLHYYCVTSIYLGILPVRPPRPSVTHFPKSKLWKVECSIFRVAKQLITKWSCFRSSRGGSDSSLVTCAGCAAAGRSHHRCQGWHFAEENPSKPPYRHEDAKSWFI